MDPEDPTREPSQPPDPSLQPLVDSLMAQAREPEPPQRRRRTPIVIAAIVVVLMLGGAAAAFVLFRGASEKVLDHVPASTDVVAVAYLDPAASQKLNLLRMASRFPSLGSSQELTDKVNEQIDLALEGTGLDHADLGWVGSEIGVAVDVPNLSSPHEALLIATKDSAASEATLQSLRDRPASESSSWTSESHGGVDMWIGMSGDGGSEIQAIVGGVVVLSNSQSMVEGIIDASQGKVPRLQDDADFTSTMADLPASNLGFVYVNPQPLIETLKGSAGFPALSIGPGLADLEAIRGFAASVSAEPDGLAIDTTERFDRSKLSPDRIAQLSEPPHADPLLTSVPSDAWGVISIEHIDTTLKSFVDQARATDPLIGGQLDAAGVPDLIAALTGDLVIEGGPGSSPTAASLGGSIPGGALMLGTSDEGQVRSSLDQLAGIVSTLTHLKWNSTVYKGVHIQVLATGQFGLPVAPAYAIVNDAAVIATSVSELQRIIDAAGGDQNITTSPLFVAAKSKVPPSSLVFLDVQGLASVISAQLSAGEQAHFAEMVQPDLQHVIYLVTGGESTPDRTKSRLFIKIP
ncbi:MAG: DUF3352 domain-containing protein [Actinomycetota bacterium]|nr:DUF3352 domain-containing protein [Actinomycetota bacterium]